MRDVDGALARVPTAVRIVVIDGRAYPHVSVTLAADRYRRGCTDPAAHCLLLHVNHARYSTARGPLGWGVTAERPPLTVAQLDLFGEEAI